MLTTEGKDSHHEDLRNRLDAHGVRCREHFLRLWSRTAPFLDANLVERARLALHPVYWEMQLAAGLLDAGATLTPREQRSPRNEGPDIRSATPAAWFEAVTIEAGVGEDAVPSHPDGVAYSVPDDQLVLRITNALRAKRDKHETYLTRDWLSASEPYIVAVNGGGVPNGASELPLPRIVRAVFPFGHFAVPIDARTGEFGAGFYRHRAFITKAKGGVVSTALFEDPAYSGVSAALYSSTNAFNPPVAGKSGMILVHNPLATMSRFPRGVLKNVADYWLDGDELRWE